MFQHLDTNLNLMLLQLTQRIAQHFGPSAPQAANLLHRAAGGQPLLSSLTSQCANLRLVEFRSTTTSSSSSRSRMRKLAAGLRSEPLLLLSRSLHWVAGDTLPESRRVRPYVAARNQPSQALSLPAMLDDFAKDAMAGNSMDPELARRYLQLVVDSFSAGDSAWGVALTLNAQAELVYLALEDIRDLSATPAELLARRAANSSLS